jgi:choline dehydrogenase-like flavoprotein
MQTINWHDDDHRSSSASAYLTPVESTRTNWITLVNHHVSTLLWSSDNSKFAHGVQFKQSDNTGQEYQVYVRKEVILAAGAINTPALLQRSGVGDPALLGPLGIDTVLNITTVGKNLQEQTQTAMGAGSNGFNPGGNGPSDVIAYPNLYQLFGDQGTSIASTIRTSINTWAASQASNALSQAALQTIYQVQADLIVNKNGMDHSQIFLKTDF